MAQNLNLRELMNSLFKYSQIIFIKSAKIEVPKSSNEEGNTLFRETTHDLAETKSASTFPLSDTDFK